MTRLVAMVLVMSLLACKNNGSSTDAKLDSIGKKFDSSAERLWDSTRQKAEEIKERVENKLEAKDSAQHRADSL